MTRSRSTARGLTCHASELLHRLGEAGALEVEVELTLPDGAVHRGLITVVRDAEGYRTFGERPEHWIGADLLAPMRELGQLGFDRAVMALWLAALDVLP